MGRAGPGPVDKSEGFRGPGRPRPVDKSEGLGGARLAQGQPIEVRGFGVTGPGLAGPPSLANPHLTVVWGLKRRNNVFQISFINLNKHESRSSIIWYKRLSDAKLKVGQLGAIWERLKLNLWPTCG